MRQAQLSLYNSGHDSQETKKDKFLHNVLTKKYYLCNINWFCDTIIMRKDKNILHEKTPSLGMSIVYIVDRKQKAFDYPLHKHEVFELNFLERASGALRIVGDSQEVIDDIDLVLIANRDLEHIWEKHQYDGTSAREVTIQFDIHFENDQFLSSAPFMSIRKMILEAHRGLVFSKDAIHKVYHHLDRIGEIQDNFYAVQEFMTILYELSKRGDSRQLASESYVDDSSIHENETMERVKEYIGKNYLSEITLPNISRHFCMSVSSFGRFFKQHTGKTLSEYLITMRLSHAVRLLSETDKTVADVSFSSGFNNLSHFNRLFKRSKGCSPSQFRELYRMPALHNEKATFKYL